MKTKLLLIGYIIAWAACGLFGFWLIADATAPKKTDHLSWSDPSSGVTFDGGKSTAVCAGRELCECVRGTVRAPNHMRPPEDNTGGVIPSAGTAGLPTQKQGENIVLRPGDKPFDQIGIVAHETKPSVPQKLEDGESPTLYVHQTTGVSEGFTMPADAGDQYAKRDRSKPLVIPLRDVADNRVVGRMVFEAEVYEVRE